MVKCLECSEILDAGVTRCPNCGVAVNASRPCREIDEGIHVDEQQPEVIDLTDLDVVDLRELIVQLDDEAVPDSRGVAADRTARAVAGGTMLLTPPAIREQWHVQSRTSKLLFPTAKPEPRLTFDDIAAHDVTPSALTWTPTTAITLGLVVGALLIAGILAAAL